ncbi:MAG: alpha/beta fold hydrolase [Gemmatimonadaceae bacterium]
MSNQLPFQPAWWLPGAHLPTMFSKLLRQVAPAHDRIESWPTPDGDSVSVVRVDPARPDAPTLTIFHGLEGTVRSTYAQGLMHQAKARGWGAAMLIWRTCDGRIPAVPRMYHSGETADADFFIRRLAAERPGTPLLCAGVSLGANVLLKWLGEQGRRVPTEVRRAIAVSTPFDLLAGSRFLEQGFARLYSWHFVRSLKRKGAAAIARHPQLPVNRARVAAARTFWEFDDAFTGPVHGFAGADDYYARSSSINFLSEIAVPTLLFSAVDDPFLPPVVLDRVRAVAGRNPLISIEFTPRGGHVGWIAGPPWRPVYHLERRAALWLETGM